MNLYTHSYINSSGGYEALLQHYKRRVILESGPRVSRRPASIDTSSSQRSRGLPRGLELVGRPSRTCRVGDSPARYLTRWSLQALISLVISSCSVSLRYLLNELVAKLENARLPSSNIWDCFHNYYSKQKKLFSLTIFEEIWPSTQSWICLLLPTFFLSILRIKEKI